MKGKGLASKGPARMGTGYHGQRADIQNKGLFHTIEINALNIIISQCMRVLIKRDSIVQVKINHTSGLNRCVYFWLTGLPCFLCKV